MKAAFLPLAIAGGLLVCAVGAQAQGDYSNGVYANINATTTYPCNDTKFLADQKKFENGTITADQLENVCGVVTAVLPEKKTTSGHHGYFYVQVAPKETIEIVSDLDQMDAPAWPWVAVGDSATVRGRYYYDNDTSQGIDWTHHGTDSSWTHPGYVVINGTTKYQ